ncbi:hypothetical protein I316_05167 [Kwoniella heveanensis BCC8398]|uniref:Uncharacterized protein n=1 Tax=Kwoniella heveanensis BCC8398 TaxID=1296120 RepID=A0A1B9GPY6_9TREE|nr:hypothetical protein I316_05167 [Kwoniella heveanensis BCC8398]
MATSFPIHPPEAATTAYKHTSDDPYNPSSSGLIASEQHSMPTPSLSGPTTPLQPETPHTIHLQTPSTTIEMDHAEPSASASGSRATSPSRDVVDAFGWTEQGKDNGKGKGRVLDLPQDSVPDAVNALEDEDAEGGSILDIDGLRRMQERIAAIGANERNGDGWAQRDELLKMTKSLLSVTMEELPFLQERLAAQQDTIKTMQQQSRLSEQLMAVERHRHIAERQSWHAETRALVNAREAEIAAGTRQRRVLDLDVGYHQELEASNKRLEMDNRLMAPRLSDTQRQIDKLVNELRILRSHVILHSQPIAKPGDQQSRRSRHVPPLAMMPLLPTSTSGPGSGRRKSRSPIKGSGKTTMGDARAEHLLLAAKRVRTMRQTDERVGRLTLEEMKRNGVVGPDGGVGYTEGYGRGEFEAEDEDSELEEKPALTHARRPSASVKSKAPPQGSPLLPRIKRSGKRPTQPPPIPQTPSKSSRKQPPPQTTPGGSNFNDLLRAAEMATRPGTPTPEDHSQIVPLSAMSATRSTTRARDESASERGSPVKRARRDEWSSGREDEMPAPTLAQTQQSVPASQQSASALDLLAQASQLEVAQSGEMSSSSSTGPPPPPLPSATRLGGLMGDYRNRGSSPSSVEEPSLGPAIDLTPYSRGAKTSAAQARIHQPQPSVMEDQQIDPSLTTPKGRSRAYSNASELATPMTGRAYASSQVYPTPGAESLFEEGTPRSDINLSYASPTGGTVPGLGKYVHLTSSMPARRVRSPYLKWTVEEDELLARAVAIHGEKWDLVSKGVPTRSYHQVRQRWLRKTGAFDKKPQGDDIKGDVIQVEAGNGNDVGDGAVPMEDDESPTPGGGGGSKKRRKSQASA